MIRRLWILWMLLGVAFGPALVGRAVPRVVTDHAKPTRTFNVCLLLLRSQKSDVPYWNSDPWFLPVVNHSPFKPAGWTLDNPLASVKLQANADLLNSGVKFQADPKGGGTGSTNWYTNSKAWGATLTKDDPAYWAVQIDKASLDALAGYDLLIINGHSGSTLTNDERNALRYLLERGATLWVNNSQRTGNQLYNFFLDPPIVFQPGPYNGSVGPGATTWLKPILPDHWLLSAHYRLSTQETSFLRDNVSDKSFILSGVAGYAGGNNSQVQEVVRLVRNNADGTVTAMGPCLAAGRVGNGQVIITGTDIMGATADWWELHHNYKDAAGKALRDLNVWPYNEALGEDVPQDAVPLVGAKLKPNRHFPYMASTKLFFNMLARPASWHMVGGNPGASRTYDASFSASLARGWSDGFTALNDPVSSGNYVAVVGNTANPPAQDANELRLYRTRKLTDDGGSVLDYPYGLYDEYQRKVTPTLLPRTAVPWWDDVMAPLNYRRYPKDATADSEMDVCFVKGLPAGESWIGSPVFGKITTGTVTRTVLYALQRRFDAGANRWECQVRAFAIDPYVWNTAGLPQVGDDLWAASPSPVIPLGLPRVSLTLSNNRLVVTALGKTSITSNGRIFILDARTGELRAQVGGAPEIGANFRPTGPASMVTAQVEFEASDLEAGVSTTSGAITSPTYNPMLAKLRKEVVEMLAVPGEYFSPSQTASLASQPTVDEIAGGQAALFLIPPTFIFRSTNAQRGTYFSRVPTDLAITDALGKRYVIGSPSSDFRRRYMLNVKTEPNGLKVTFRNWDAFFPQGASSALLTLPLTITYTPERTVVGGGSAQSTAQVSIAGVLPAMGYPVLLRGTQRYEILDANSAPLRSTLRWFDGDILYDGGGQRIAGGTFGFAVDAPPLIFRDQLVVGTNTNGTMDFPGLKNSLDPLAQKPMRQGGAVHAVRLRIPALSTTANPGNVASWRGELAWQFHGDTHGPRSYDLQQWFWRTDFPYPAAADKDTVYATGLYRGYGDYEGGTVYSELGASSLYRGMLYAINPDAPRNLLQTMAAGMVRAGIPPVGYDPRRTLRIVQTDALGNPLQDAVRRGTLRVGARVLLKGAAGTWDMGTITQIRNITDGVGNVLPGEFWMVCDRMYPVDPAIFNPTDSEVLTATSVPYVSHVRAWNADTGEEPLRRYARDGNPATRTSEGICSIPPAGESACPDNTAGQQDVMIAFNQLDLVCHAPNVVNSTTRTLAPNDDSAFLPLDWRDRNFAYLPRVPFAVQSNLVAQSASVAANSGLAEPNYTVDARTGRIQLSARNAGEFADRFVALHYFTQEMVDEGGTMVPKKVRHAEVMYVPSAVRWQYLFTDAIPDSGPTVVNNTLYITAIRKTVTNTWQPTLYAFAVIPEDPQHVQPLWMQPLGATLPATDPLPYRGITSAVPTPTGILVGTALEGVANNALTLFGDRGLVIADGHRLLRTDHDGQVRWQAAATKDYDPLALLFSATRANQTIGLTQQEFTLVTRVHRLPNGNLLACDTGANRIVELDREGTAVWQYPDSNLTYQDPDRKLDGTWIRSDALLNTLRTAGVTPLKLRLNGPRDVRRYYTEKIIGNANFLQWDLLAGIPLGKATIRWEITVITDTGNNRVLETVRPLVRLDDADATEVGRLSYARGFHYRPDVYYIYNGNKVYLQQSVEVLANGTPGQTVSGPGAPGEQNSLALADGTPLKAPLVFTTAMRYPGSDGQLKHLRDDADPLLDGVRTRELLAAVGNPTPDPADPARFLRTAFVHVAGGTGAAVLGNYASLTVASGAGDTTLALSYVNDLMVGDVVLLKDPANPDPKAVFTTTVKTITAAAKTIIVDPALDKAFPIDSRVIAVKRWNALAIRPNMPPSKPTEKPKAYDYARLMQLDLISLTTPAGGQEVRALVVDASGVREVPLDPTRQGTPVFEMGQLQYTAATTKSALWEQMVDVRYARLGDNERNYLKATISAWKKDNYRMVDIAGVPTKEYDSLFAPVAVLRLDPGAGLTTTDRRTVRYLVGQMNTTINPDPATWPYNKAERRIHLFEARWFDMNAADQTEPNNGWRIIDSEWNYFLYPDPLTPGFPNLPGWTYPLSQPLSLDRD